MTPDLFAPALVLDTSVLHSSSVTSAPFQVLIGLVEAGLVRVFIPELAAEEFRTQWRDRNQANVSQSVKALKALSGEALLPDSVITGTHQLSHELSNIDLEVLSIQFSENYLKENGFQTLPLSFGQAKDAWRSYFLGNLPSKKAKHRSDIPDAHILAALKELVGKESNCMFASSDKGQREAASEIGDLTCFDNLEALIKSPQLQPLVAKWQIDEKWKAIQATLAFELVAERVRIYVHENGGELLSWEEVSDPQIPEDNHSASITLFGEPEEVEIEGPEDWGGGILRYTATYFSECLLSFRIFRGDSFDVPEWVSVTFGDFEKDHYFDAEGYAAVVVDVDVTVRIKVGGDLEKTEDLIEDVYFETGSLKLSLAPYN